MCNYYYCASIPVPLFARAFIVPFLSLFLPTPFSLRINSSYHFFLFFLELPPSMKGRRWWIDERASIDSSRPDKRRRKRNALSQIIWALGVNRETKTFRFSSLRYCWGRREKERERDREIEKKKHVSQGSQVFRRAVTVSRATLPFAPLR